MLHYTQTVQGVKDAWFLGDGHTVLLAAKNGKVFTRDIKQFEQLDTDSQVNLDINVVLSPNKQLYCVYSTKHSTCDVFTVRSQPVASFSDLDYGIKAAIWAPDSQQVLIFSNYSVRVTAINIVSGDIAYIRSPKHYNKGVSFSSDGLFMALAERRQRRDCVGVYYTKDWTLVRQFELDTLDVQDLMWAPNSSFIVVVDTSMQYKLLPICPHKGPLRPITNQPADLGVKTLAFSHDSSLLATGSYDSKVRLINTSRCQPIIEFECQKKVKIDSKIKCYRQAVRNSHGQACLFQKVENEVFHIPTAKISGDNSTILDRMGIGMLEFSFDDHFLAFRNNDMAETVWIYDLEKLGLACILTFANQVSGIKWSPVSNRLCVADGTNHVTIWSDTADSLSNYTLPVQPPTQVERVKWSESGHYFLLMGAKGTCIANQAAKDDHIQ